MKRLASLTIVLLCMAFGAAAQQYYEPHFAIGGKAGITMSNMQFAPSVEQKMLQGKMIGFTMRYIEEKIFGLVAELNVTQRGWCEDFGETEFDYKRTLTYVQIPLLTHIYFGSRKFKGFINLGPSVAYMIDDKISANFNYEDPKSVEGFPIRYRHVEQLSMPVKNKFDYGVVAGAGMELIIKRKHSILLEGRYYFGLGSIYSTSKKDTFSSSRGSSIEVSLGYMFHVK